MIDSLKGIAIAVATWMALSLLIVVSNTANALDDFDLMKYGPDDTIEVQRKLDEAFNGASEEPMPEGSGVRGFAVVAPSQDVCFIHIIPAKIWDDREAMAIMGHELYHCLLSDHSDLEVAETDKEVVEDEAAMGEIEIPQDIEDLYTKDRELELEWLKEEYEEMGIVIDE